MGKYKFSDKVGSVEVRSFIEEKGIIVIKKDMVRGVCPFGPGHGVITDEDLTDDIAEWLIQKPEYKEGGRFAGVIVKTKEK